MNIHNASITISAVKPAQYPKTYIPEIALAGRSNVGKSSFVNKLLNRKNLARTSSKPGKTATLNFYNIDETFFFVDLPGYGYAEVSKKEREKWGEMIDTYLNKREQLRMTFLLVDARHKPTAEDVAMHEWIKHFYGKSIVIATKVDKVKKSKLDESIELIGETLSLEEDDTLLLFSSETGNGVEDAWEIINEIIHSHKSCLKILIPSPNFILSSKYSSILLNVSLYIL